ncbi:MAG: carbohydrate kinase family protein [Candidatus Thermoplasmatota archaeon]
MSRPAFLAVCGHSNLDVLLRVKDLPQPGQSTPVIERRVARGGNGSNIASHAATLGVPVRLWSRVGDDFPDDWRLDLERLGVDLTHMAVVPGATTPTCFIFTDLLDRQCFAIDGGPMAAMAQSPPGPGLVEGLAPGGWLHVSTGDPLAYAPVIDAARQAGVRIALDPGQEMSFRYDARSLAGLLAWCDILFLNEAELRVACGLLGLSSAEELVAQVPAVVVTRGEKGASLYRRDERTVHAPAFAVDRIVDPTGAGDAFRAGWYAALMQNHPLSEALRWGQAAGAAKTRHAGSQGHLLTPDDLTRFLGSA